MAKVKKLYWKTGRIPVKIRKIPPEEISRLQNFEHEEASNKINPNETDYWLMLRDLDACMPELQAILRFSDLLGITAHKGAKILVRELHNLCVCVNPDLEL